METIARSPYVQLEFNKTGQLRAGSGQAILQALAAAQAEDLLVLSHGWKFEGAQPRRFYERLWLQVAANLDKLEPAKIVLIGLVWPSKRYATGLDAVTARAVGEGGALATEAGEPPTDASEADLRQAVEDAVDALELQSADADGLRNASRAYAETGAEQSALDLLVTIGGRTSLETADPELASEARNLRRTGAQPGHTMNVLTDPPQLTLTRAAGGTLGLGERIGGTLRGPRAAVIRVLEQFSYFEMKVRAGTVGANLGSLLRELRPDRPTRLHLVGHSFGARLVTAAANSFERNDTLDLFSLTLLQGAYSHSALSRARGGPFYGVVGRVSGPITITHTHNDDACTVAYAVASRLSRDVANMIGDAKDPFGSMGANGAQFGAGEPAARAVSTGAPFRPARGTITNFRADGYIREPDAHNDVENTTVGALVAATLEA